jgi:hypothetical protein
MKIRNGFVSNSSSSSFVILKDAINEEQQSAILNYVDYISGIISNLPENSFEYYDSPPWYIKEYDTFIFGETSMDNFDMGELFKYINVNDDYVCFDEGYLDEPNESQLRFINRMKLKLRADKITKVNKL